MSMDYLIPPCAVGLTLPWVFKGLMDKSALQAGEPLPKMSYFATVKEGFKAVPLFGSVIGAQIVLKRKLERGMPGTPLARQVQSAAFVGFVSIPFLAAMNGRTFGWSFMQSCRNLTRTQAVAIWSREMSFLLAVTVDRPLNEWRARRYGGNRYMDYAVAFASGCVGGAVGHPSDSLLTRAQRRVAYTHWQQNFQGLARRSVAIGGFSVLYKFFTESLSNRNEIA